MTPEYEDLAEIDGWFDHVDYLAFRTILSRQTEAGDIAEIGPFLGRCTVVLGGAVRAAESLKVVDLFGRPARGEENAAEVEWNSYESLSRSAFEANFLRHHDWLPDIFEGESSDFLNSLTPRSIRFAHVDGSHAFPNVSADLALMQPALTRNGIIVIDDFRTEHAPGVAAALWPLVNKGLLFPFALTPQKMYASLRPQDELSEVLAQSAESEGYTVNNQSVTRDGRLIPRISGRIPKEQRTGPTRRQTQQSARRLAKILLRPALNFPRRAGR
jgi:hypothetical protein